MNKLRWATTLGFVLASVHSFALTLDEKLAKIVEVYDLKPISCESDHQPVDAKLANLGKALFESKFLSGEGDTSCSTCHLEEKALTDGLPLAVGVGGGHSEGAERLAAGSGIMVPRNAFTLAGRGSVQYLSYFWDGRIELQEGQIISPFGNLLDKKFSSQLAVAAVQPILARDEFLGRVRFLSDNVHVDVVNNRYYHDRFLAASRVIRDKLRTIQDNEEVSEITLLAREVGLAPEDLDLAVIGNAIASFIATELSCFETPWNSYLGKDSNVAISKSAKEGALLFYGKGRCSACHSGPLFSDFKHHSLGVPQGSFGVNALSSDEGRASFTNQYTDRYKFRTPPLLLVSKTAPYGHNGIFATLEEAVLFHINPIPFLTTYEWSSRREQLMYGKILASRDPLLGQQDILSENDIYSIVSFLQLL